MLGGHKQDLVHARTKAKEQAPTKDRERPAFECLRVSYGGMSQQWSTMRTEALAKSVLGDAVCGISPLGGGHH